jgi:hypothetical protein
MTLQVAHNNNEEGTNGDTLPSTRFAGINAAENHTSDTQFDGWITMIKDIFGIYKDSPMGQRAVIDLFDFASKIKGLSTDHAEDQKKLFRLIQEWKKLCDRERRGEDVLLSAALLDVLPVLTKANEKKIADAGGPNVWDMLSADEQATQNAETYRSVCIDLGEQAFAKLTAEEQREVDFLVWAGCCMHKEMNSVKGGNAAMAAWWEEAGLWGPMKLMNKANAAAAATGAGRARDQAVDASQSGGVKLTSLAGAVFHHKDDKKGQQDTL